MVPTSLGENVSTFSTEASVRETPNCNPPLCSRVINITWLSFAPFISQPKNSTRQTEKLDGVFYSIIGRAVQFCCKHFDNRGTRFEYTHKAENIDTLHANIFYDKASIGMPVYIENEFFDQNYGGTLAFIKVLESPGLVVIGNKDDVKQNDLKVLWKTIYNQWPIVLISVLLCAISGICVWALVSIIALFGENPNLVGINTWCFLFALANRSVHSLGKWWAKFKTSKFRPGITFTFQSTNQFLLPENDREGLNMVSKVVWRNGTRTPTGKNGSTFSDVNMLLSENFHLNDPRNRVPFTFQPVLRKLLVNDKQPHLLIISSFSALFTTRWSKFLNGNCVVGREWSTQNWIDKVARLTTWKDT